MAEKIKVTCVARDKTGRVSSACLRKSGFIPGVLYGKDVATTHIALNDKEFRNVLSRVAGESVLIDLNLEAEKKSASHAVIIKEIQREPVTDRIQHVDFQAVRLTEKLKIKVPISTKGEAPGVKEGGILEHILREVEVECLPRDIPERIEVDISNLGIGHSIHLEDLAFPPGVVPQEDKAVTILSVVPPKAEVVEEVPAEGEITEPEVITKEKKEEEEPEEGGEPPPKKKEASEKAE